MGYTYDGVISDLANYTNGSHEFSIILNLGKNEKNAGQRRPPFYWVKNNSSPLDKNE